MITKQDFGALKSGEKIALYRITNAGGAYAEILTLGATLQALTVPDRDGNLADVTVGFDDVQGHEARSMSHGQTIGRYANRIAGGRFVLDGTSYDLLKNEDGVTCLHGADEFGKAIWTAEICDDNAICFCYSSADGACGFPGAVEAEVRYTLTDDNTLHVDFRAVSDKPTVLNMTNHAYFNLSGNPASDVLAHELQINAAAFTPTDAASIPTGELRAVADTPFDFTAAKPIGRDIGAAYDQLELCRGYDHNFCLNERTKEIPAAVAYEPQSGRVMAVYTDLPGIQLYTGNFLAGAAGKGGVPQQQHSGFCLETQYFPDTPNQPSFPQCTFAAGQPLVTRTSFRFSVK